MPKQANNRRRTKRAVYTNANSSPAQSLASTPRATTTVDRTSRAKKAIAKPKKVYAKKVSAYNIYFAE